MCSALHDAVWFEWAVVLSYSSFTWTDEVKYITFLTLYSCFMNYDYTWTGVVIHSWTVICNCLSDLWKKKACFKGNKWWRLFVTTFFQQTPEDVIRQQINCENANNWLTSYVMNQSGFHHVLSVYWWIYLSVQDFSYVALVETSCKIW